MRILAIDVGTGTQDILLFDSEREPENCFKMVMPSPTAIAAGRVRRATAARQGLALSGVTMGGGPVSWALEEHLKAGLPVLATPDAARTLNDDLAEVEALGVRVVGEDEAAALARQHSLLELRDLDLPAINSALAAFDIAPDYDAVAVAVLDHGQAPPDVSDRVFRFEHIKRVVTGVPGALGNAGAPAELLAFAYLPHELPAYLTRMRAVVQSAGPLSVPLVLLDTGPAAFLGALQDGAVLYASTNDVILLNVGNMHTLAAHVLGGRLRGIFEHHTSFLTTEKLDGYLETLAAGTLENAAIYDDMGHGAYVAPAAQDDDDDGVEPLLLSVTGPRRALVASSRLDPYYATPHGDMMIAGCFGLVRAVAAKVPEWWEEIETKLLP